MQLSNLYVMVYSFFLIYVKLIIHSGNLGIFLFKCQIFLSQKCPKEVIYASDYPTSALAMLRISIYSIYIYIYIYGVVTRS